MSVTEKDMTGSERKCYHTLWLADRFYGDHTEGDLPFGKLVKHSGNRALVKCTLDELNEILDDVEHYVSMKRYDLNCSDKEYKEFQRSLVLSARRTANCINLPNFEWKH